MLQDLRHAVRALQKSPAFSLTAILTLALGIGLNTAVFGIVNLLLFRAPDVREAERLVWIASRPNGPDGPRQYLAHGDLEALAGEAAFTQVAGYGQLPISIAARGVAVRGTGQIVTGDLFALLGVRPVLGRGLSDGRALSDSSSVVLGDALRRRLFNGQRSAIGSGVILNGHPFTVVGVMPAGFVGADAFEPADLWVPMSAHAQVLPRLPGALGTDTFWLNVLARLAPGVSVAQARAVVRVLADSATRSHPDSHKDFGLDVGRLSGLGPGDRAEAVPISALLLGITSLVLLIACANVANLLLVRGVRRGPEIRLRLALGGTRWRVVRQLLVESSVIATAGALAGLLAALWGTDLLLQVAHLPVTLDTTPDRRVLAFTATTALLTTFLFGLMPALRASGVSLFPALRDAGAPGPGRARLQRGLVAAQLVSSLVLLSGTGMLLHSLAAARRVDVGFETRDRFSIGYDLQLQGYSDARARTFNRTLLDRVRALPGVRSATIARLVPAAGTVIAAPVYRAGASDEDRRLAAFNQVWPGYFGTMHIPLLAGRGFDETEAIAGSPVAVVSEAFAARYWPGENPLGRRFRLGVPGEPVREIIGVTKNVMIDEYNEAPWAAAYVPHTGAPDAASLIVETDGRIGAVSRAVSASFAALDPNLPLEKVTMLDEHLAGRLDKQRALTRVLAVAGALALILAALGLYGLVAHAVSSRQREVGVRVALGATRREVLGLFIAQSARLVGLGLAIALPIAGALSAVVASSLVGVAIGDPLPLAAAAVLLSATMLVATWVPARRALAVDPSVVLKAE